MTSFDIEIGNFSEFFKLYDFSQFSKEDICATFPNIKSCLFRFSDFPLFHYLITTRFDYWAGRPKYAYSTPLKNWRNAVIIEKVSVTKLQKTSLKNAYFKKLTPPRMRSSYYSILFFFREKSNGGPVFFKGRKGKVKWIDKIVLFSYFLVPSPQHNNWISVKNLNEQKDFGNTLISKHYITKLFGILGK